MMQNKLFTFFILIILGLAACDQKNEEPVDMKYRYFPVEENVYHIYQVDSVIWDDFYTPPRIDTVSMKIKKLIKSDFQDEENRTVFRVERFIKQHDTLNWNINKVYTLMKDSGRVIKTIDNQAIIKLVFPFDIGTAWDANIYNSNQPDEYEITEINGSQKVNDDSYENTITVEQENQQTLISNDQAYEVYAPDVGMIYKQDISQDLDISTGEIESGYKCTYKLLEYAN
ncbi:MAG: hypothetical protein K9J21_08630 [Bacteroidales bacterium]|nr:hypothetical protein [Bacteroidales bacterium]